MQKKHVKVLIGGLAFLLAGIFYFLTLAETDEPVWDTEVSETTYMEPSEEITGEPGRIYVHICGEVVSPGVYEVSEGVRVYELLSMAGGATEDGAPDTINLADVLKDGQRVVIPSKEEAASMAASSGEQGAGLVNINSASVERLMTLPGIGESKAKDIVRYREENGGFQAIEDIMKISGIKDAVFQKIRGLITI